MIAIIILKEIACYKTGSMKIVFKEKWFIERIEEFHIRSLPPSVSEIVYLRFPFYRQMEIRYNVINRQFLPYPYLPRVSSYTQSSLAIHCRIIQFLCFPSLPCPVGSSGPCYSTSQALLSTVFIYKSGKCKQTQEQKVDQQLLRAKYNTEAQNSNRS